MLPLLLSRSTINCTRIFAAWRSQKVSHREYVTYNSSYSVHASTVRVTLFAVFLSVYWSSLHVIVKCIDKQTDSEKVNQIHVGCCHGDALPFRERTCTQGTSKPVLLLPY